MRLMSTIITVCILPQHKKLLLFRNGVAFSTSSFFPHDENKEEAANSFHIFSALLEAAGYAHAPHADIKTDGMWQWTFADSLRSPSDPASRVQEEIKPIAASTYAQALAMDTSTEPAPTT